MSSTHLILEAAREIDSATKRPGRAPAVFVGLDGFVDEIVKIVDQRTDYRTFTPIDTIEGYAARLAQAAGKSTNVELVLQQTKMGGNGPLLADAFGRMGVRVTTVGALGKTALHPVFEPLAEYGRAISLVDPAITLAAEFDDGKIMHGMLETLNDITTENLIAGVGGEEELLGLLEGTDLVALVNWTMIPHLTEVYRGILERVKRMDSASRPKFFFFDLCDPQKRSREALREAIATIASYAGCGARPILGLNEKESAEVCAAFKIEVGSPTPEALLERARRLVDVTGVPEILIHPHACAVAVSPEGEGIAPGPYCDKPRLTTGAGDSFNGGYCLARLLGLSPRLAVVVGNAVSGFYVRASRAPARQELIRFFSLWAEGALDPWEDGNPNG